MKKLVVTICCAILLTGSCLFAQNAPVITAGTVVADGSVFTVPFTVTNFTGIRSFNLKLSYNGAQATAMAVTAGTTLGGNLASNLGFPGVIALGWYTWPGVSLPDNSMVFNITFARIGSGPVAISWLDDGTSCQWWDSKGEVLNDMPTEAFYFCGSAGTTTGAPLTKAPVIAACPGSQVDVPVTVFSFNSIGAISLTMQYDPAILVYRSSVSNPGFPGLSVTNPSPGVITAQGSGPSGGITLAAGSALFTLRFDYSGGSGSLVWTDNGSSDEYKGPSPSSAVLTNNPRDSYFVNGTITEAPVPDPAGPIGSLWGSLVTQGQTGVVYTVAPILNATEYVWSLPEGASITAGENTAAITVAFSDNAISGEISVSGFNGCHTGLVSASFPVVVNLKTGIETIPTGTGGGTINLKAFPNPFSSTTTLDFSLRVPGTVQIEVINALGDIVLQISDGNRPAGHHSRSLSIANLAPGIYSARIITRTSDRVEVDAVRIICIR